MDKIFFQMPCLSESREIKSQEIFDRLFDKKIRDKRYIETDVQKFILLNKKAFQFLGINVEVNGSGRDLSIKFYSSSFIGAIPVKMPYDGRVHKDFLVTPRFDRTNDVFSDLTQLLGKLEYSIAPEYADSEELCQPIQLRPPMYYEAAKYIDAFEQAYKYNWSKFEVVQGKHNYPKSNTNWAKYAMDSADPAKALVYHSSDSIFSTNHKEWQELTYVFEMACSIILQPNVPNSLRYKYIEKIAYLEKKISSIEGHKTDCIVLHASDPSVIKAAKAQANVLLTKGTTTCSAWRIDMAQLFERYVQYIVSCSLKGLNGSVLSNKRIRGRGQIPSWGLKYLEPDIIIKFDSGIYMADAKYKAHYYAYGQNSQILKDTHRADLHQLLAYCSFSPEKNKTGILFYPSENTSYHKIEYTESICGINNTVYLFGIPFGINEMESSISCVKSLFLKRLEET